MNIQEHFKGHDRETLLKKCQQLKESDGEGHAIGSFVEQLLKGGTIDAKKAVKQITEDSLTDNVTVYKTIIDILSNGLADSICFNHTGNGDVDITVLKNEPRKEIKVPNKNIWYGVDPAQHHASYKIEPLKYRNLDNPDIMLAHRIWGAMQQMRIQIEHH